MGATVMRSAQNFLSGAWFYALLLVLSSSAFASEGKVTVFQPEGEAFAQVTQAIVDDMSEELEIETVPIGNTIDAASLKTSIAQSSPDAIVLLGNAALNAFVKLKAQGNDLPPALVTAALFVEQSLGQTQGVIAIRYEVPLVTSLVNTRNAIERPLTRIGVLYREQLATQMQEQAKYCEAENIELVMEALPTQSINMDKKVSKALKRLVRKNVDGYILLNDNGLLTSATMKKAWLPVLGRQNVPVVVGIDALMSTDLNVGAFSIAPDHYGLGLQAASSLWDLLDNDWQIEEVEVLQPLSVKKKVNTSVLDVKGIALKEGAVDSFDSAIE